jgi:hypothetical protein
VVIGAHARLASYTPVLESIASTSDIVTQPMI